MRGCQPDILGILIGIHGCQPGTHGYNPGIGSFLQVSLDVWQIFVATMVILVISNQD